MSYKQRALKMLADLGASDAGSEYDDMFRHWTVDYRTPQGKRWAATGDHMSWTREDTMIDCWRSLIKTARMGVEDCPSDCDCFLADDQPVVVEEPWWAKYSEDELDRRADGSVWLVC